MHFSACRALQKTTLKLRWICWEEKRFSLISFYIKKKCSWSAEKNSMLFFFFSQCNKFGGSFEWISLVTTNDFRFPTYTLNLNLIIFFLLIVFLLVSLDSLISFDVFSGLSINFLLKKSLFSCCSLFTLSIHWYISHDWRRATKFTAQEKRFKRVTFEILGRWWKLVCQSSLKFNKDLLINKN